MAKKPLIIAEVAGQGWRAELAADEVARGIAEVERTLQALPGKFESLFWIDETEAVAFCRLKDEWRLAHVQPFGDGQARQPLANTSMETRAKAATYLPSLVRQMLAEYEQRRATAQAAVEGVREARRLLGLALEGE